MAPSPARLLLLVSLVALGGPARAGESEPRRPDYTKDPDWFPRVFGPYQRLDVPKVDLSNTAAVSRAIRDGRLRLSLSQMLTTVVENNLDLTVARFNTSVAETDILRAKAGQAPRGSEGAPIPSGLFAGALGAGLGGAGGAGGIGGGGGVSGQARSVSISPRGNFDPALVLNFS